MINCWLLIWIKKEQMAVDDLFKELKEKSRQPKIQYRAKQLFTH